MFVQFCFSILLFPLLPVIGPGEYGAALLQQLLFPIANLGRMQVVLRCDLADCFYPLDRFQGDLELEVVTVLSAFFVNSCPPQAGIIILQSILACGPVFGGKYRHRKI